MANMETIIVNSFAVVAMILTVAIGVLWLMSLIDDLRHRRSEKHHCIIGRAALQDLGVSLKQTAGWFSEDKNVNAFVEVMGDTLKDATVFSGYGGYSVDAVRQAWRDKVKAMEAREK